jgi:pyrroloquinoline quinone (PQQ) biosynthesis protein C
VNNYEQLIQATHAEQEYLLSAPVISDVAVGAVDLPMYQAFLTNAYHHVRYTVPLMMATAARLDPSQHKLLSALKEYVEEEFGHEQWIVEDLGACGVAPSIIENSKANFETEIMLAYVRDYINHVHPLGFFGMVHVLEGTSTALATSTADLLQQHLGLPDKAFSYLRSHGELDIAHVDFFRTVLDVLDDLAMEHVVHVARRVYRLYGDVLRSVPQVQELEGKNAA